jgi:hypothetical protein
MQKKQDNHDINNTIDKNNNTNDTTDDVNVLSGDNKVDVEIEPDVKANKINMYVQICSCSIIFHCFSNNKES